jgi:hypothetical protein
LTLLSEQGIAVSHEIEEQAVSLAEAGRMVILAAQDGRMSEAVRLALLEIQHNILYTLEYRHDTRSA